MSGTETVDAYMRALEHPRKAEIQAVREIIVNANSKIAERVKWNAPSFFYRADLGAFNPRATGFAQLILVFPNGLVSEPSGLLEGAWNDRRIARFYDLADVRAKEAALTRVVNAWVDLEEAATMKQEGADHGNNLPLPDRLGQPARRALANAGYTRLAQLAAVSEAEIARLHGVGPKALRQLREALAAHGLSFAAATGADG